MPALSLPATDGRMIRLDQAAQSGKRVVLFAYPRTGRPGQNPLVADWDLIPGARGCTPESCAFRDLAEELRGAGAEVIGLSTQDTAYQKEAVQRLHLPYPLVSDADLQLTTALRLPTFEAAGQLLLRRFTLVLKKGVIEHCFYPIFPPDRHPEEVLKWLRRQQG
ncbi:peroxiredoxin [Streptomyces cinereoruber]